MNKLIWINEEMLNEEKRFLKKKKPEKIIKGLWGFGDPNEKPICLDKNFIINWCFIEKKVEFLVTEEYVNSFCDFYLHLIYYGEGGILEEKRIIFMQVETFNLKKKSKKPFRIKEIFNFLKKYKKIKLIVFFESTINWNFNNENENKENIAMLSDIGGMVDVVLTYWENFEKCRTEDLRIHKEKEEKERENAYKEMGIAKETVKTIHEMKKYKKNWEIFKFNFR